MRYLVFIFALILITNTLHCQNLQHNALYSRLENDADFAQSFERVLDLQQQAQKQESYQAGNVQIIPVVFHIIYTSDKDNISIAQIEDGLRILNEDFRKQNADTTFIRSVFDTLAADVEIEFRLAKIDPNGNCTDGITRTQSEQSIIGDQDVKDLIHWDNSSYYNIWVTRNVMDTRRNKPSTLVLGTSSFPAQGGQHYKNDGTIIRHDEVGSIGTSVSTGRTLTRETGRYLGLLNTFEDYAGGTVGGCFKGDNIDDTPPVAVKNTGCDTNANSCNNEFPDVPDMIENYMDFADCSCMFTKGQKAVMKYTLDPLSNLRYKLTALGNLDSTGVNNPPPCAPVARFAADKTLICANESIQFYDLSEEGNPSHWEWTFYGSDITSSHQQNPVVSYAVPGDYPVTLKVTNAEGTNTSTIQEYIHVRADENSVFFDKLWTTSFEGNSLQYGVTIVDHDQNPLSVYNGSSTHLDQSLRLEAKPNRFDEIDEIITPKIATDGAVDLNLYFDYAFTSPTYDNYDELFVFISTDCGETWTEKSSYTGASLRTAPLTDTNFVPTRNQWYTQILNLDEYVPNTIMIKFTYVNGGGNNFYFDNLRIGEGIGVSLEEAKMASLNFFPNPSNGELNFKANNLNDKELVLGLYDITGRKVFTQNLASENGSLNGSLQLTLSPGIYQLLLTGQNTKYSQQIVIE